MNCARRAQMHILIFSLPVRKYKKSYCSTPCIDVGVGISGGVGVNKTTKFYVKACKTLYFIKSSDGFSLYLVWLL